VEPWRIFSFLAVPTTAAWSLAVVGQKYGLLTVPGAGSFARVLPVGWPLLLTLRLLLVQTPPSRLERALTAWAWILTAALFSATQLMSGPSIAYAVPGLAVAALAVARFPTTALLLAVAITGSFGSLAAFTHAPTGYAETVVLAGVWLGMVAGSLLGTRRVSIRAWPGLLAVALFLVLTLVQIGTQNDVTGAIDSFRTNGWYLAAVLAVALCDWPADVFDRASRGIVVIALLVGAYAVLRLAIGPAKEELQLAYQSTYNLVGGKPKLAGSLANGDSLGVWTATMIPFCAAVALAHRGRWRTIAASAVVLCAIALFASKMRAGALGVLAGLAVVIILYQAARPFPGVKLATSLWAVAFLLFAGTIGFAVSGDSASHSYGALFHPGSDPSVVQRQAKWSEALRDLEGHPFGFGLGTASSGYSGVARNVNIFSPSVASRSIDNGYLKVALEQGLPLMGMFIVAMLLLAAGLAWHAAFSFDRSGVMIALGAAGALVSFLVLLIAGAFQEGLPALAVWTVAGMGAAQVTRRGAGEPAAAPAPPARPAPPHP
jgi:hypothetical protein